MSAAASQAYIAEVKTLINETYYTFAAFTLLAFEYAITFDREVHLVWGRKVTGAMVLFVLNRYWLFLEYITQVVTTFPISELSCDVVGYMVIVGNAGPPLIWAVFSTLRGYALSGRRWWVAPLIFTFYVPHLVCNCIYYSKLVPTLAPPPFNCLLASGLPEETWIHYTIAGRVCLIVGDMIVLAITWHSTFGIAKAVSIMRMRMSLTNAILKDGTLYFVCLLILNVVNIIINAIPNSSAVSAFQDPITSILVSRFLLNLRDTLGNNERSSRPSFVRSFHGQSVLTSVQFADFVDPMGAELTHSIPSSDTPSMVWSEDDEDDDNGTTGNELASLATNHAPSSNIDGINFQDKDPESVEAHMPAGNDVARFPSLQHDASTRHDVTIVTPAIHNPNP